MTGKVYLVGAGPGDPGLITVKGRSILERADSILFDHLAPESLLDLAPASAERVYVGKKRAAHAASQEEICDMLVERARRGLTVVRLKGGDPFIFGRGGEEVEALADAGIPYEVVPGITTPLGIAAYTGVPLTHRDHTSVVTFVTGHDVHAIDWQRVGFAETLVIFMGLTSLDAITREILKAGRSPDTPAMAVRWATRPDQRTVVGNLGNIARLVEQGHLQPPATVILGDVVTLRGKLDWFEKLPLFGRRIVITRAAGQAGDLADRLRALGAEAIEFPTIAIEPAHDPAPLDAAVSKLETYDWLIFTSYNGVRFFMDRLDASQRDLRALRARLCAIGPATRAALERLHLKVDLMPPEYVAESLVEAFAPIELDRKRVLLPRAAVARDLVPESLRRRGAIVDVVEAYHTVVPESSRELAPRIFAGNRKPDWITFTSSSTVKNFLALSGSFPDCVRVASIGPVTSATARELGMRVDVEATEHTIPGLISAMIAHA